MSEWWPICRTGQPETLRWYRGVQRYLIHSWLGHFVSHFNCKEGSLHGYQLSSWNCMPGICRADAVTILSSSWSALKYWLVMIVAVLMFILCDQSRCLYWRNVSPYALDCCYGAVGTRDELRCVQIQSKPTWAILPGTCHCTTAFPVPTATHKIVYVLVGNISAAYAWHSAVLVLYLSTPELIPTGDLCEMSTRTLIFCSWQTHF